MSRLQPTPPNAGSLTTRRDLLRGGITYAAGALLAAGCGRPAGGPRVTLTQWYHQYGEAGTEQAVHRYAGEYTRAHPDVAVRVVWVPGDYASKLATALLTGSGPDVFESSLTYAMVQAGQVAPLDDLLDARTRADYDPRDLAVNTVGGRLYGIKMLDDTAVLYYRKSLLRVAGITPLRDLGSALGLMDAAKRLTTGARKGLFVGNDGGITSLLTLAPWSAGSDFVVDDRIAFDEGPNLARTAAAYEWVRTLNDSGALLIGAPTDWWEPSSLIQGLAAMQWCGLWAYPAIRRALGDDVGAVPWPPFDAAGSPVTFAGGWTAMVSAQSAHVEEAKRYVKWLWVDNPRDQLDFCLSYGFHVPPRTSLAHAAAPLRAPVPGIAVDTLRRHGRATPPIWNSAMGTALTDAFASIVKNYAPAEAAIVAAGRKCRRELQRALE